jgi:diguanylate cyclase (GGDEF)-like protein
MTTSAATPPAAPAAEASVLLERAEEARLAGDYRSGSDLARRALALAESSGDIAGQADALHMLASQLLRLGEYEDAIFACRDAVALLESGRSHRSVVCNVLTVEALSLTELGMHEEALHVLSRAREIAYELVDRDLLYWVHNRTGVVHGNMGNHRLSTEYLMRALDMVDGMDDEARFCILNNVGDNAVHRVAELRAEGDLTAAETMLSEAMGRVSEALRLARAAAHPYRESICLDNLGMLLALAGDHAGAERIIGDARAIAARHGYPSLESSSIQHHAQVRMMRGDCATAITELLEALGRVLEAGEVPVAMEIHRELSDAFETVGDPGSALRHYREYHRLERAAHNELAAVRARMAQHHFELDNARLEADNARLETELHRLRTVELEAEKAALQQQATEDPLTGLANRRHAELWLAAVAGAGRLLGVAMVDVDLFKTVNDRFGHLVGDRVLQQIASTLRAGVRESDLVARVGGEEFLVGVDGLSHAEASERCERLRAAVAAFPWESLQPGLAVTVSIGLAIVQPGGDLAAATALADQCLYAAKRQGRNRVEAIVGPHA